MAALTNDLINTLNAAGPGALVECEDLEQAGLAQQWLRIAKPHIGTIAYCERKPPLFTTGEEVRCYVRLALG